MKLRECLVIAGVVVVSVFQVFAANYYETTVQNKYTGKPDYTVNGNTIHSQISSANKQFTNYTAHVAASYASIPMLSAHTSLTTTAHGGIISEAHFNAYSAHVAASYASIPMLASHTSLTTSAHGGIVSSAKFTNNSTYTAAHIRALVDPHPAPGNNRNIPYNCNGAWCGASMLNYSGGRAGVGTSNPTSTIEALTQWATGGVGTQQMFIASSFNDVSRFTMRRSQGTVAAPTQITSGMQLGNFSFRGHDGTNFSSTGIAAITANAEETFTSTAQGTRMGFFTTPIGSTAAAERITVKNDGKIGFGTNAPLAPFHNASSATGRARGIFGNPTNTNSVIADQNLGIRLKGNATTWDDLRIEPVARAGAGLGTAPAYASSPWDTLLFNYVFTNGPTAEYLYYNIQLPHNWLEQSEVYPHIHFAPHTTGTGQVDFTLYCSVATPMTGTFGTGSSYTSSYNITANSQYKHLIASNSTPKDMTGLLTSSAGSCYITRSMSDTYAGSVSIMYIDYHYEIDSMGSDTEYSKTATP